MMKPIDIDNQQLREVAPKARARIPIRHRPSPPLILQAIFLGCRISNHDHFIRNAGSPTGSPLDQLQRKRPVGSGANGLSALNPAIRPITKSPRP
jgi:hypothetical protein